MDPPPVELAFVHEPCSGLGQRGHRRGPCLRTWERRGRARLVVVLDEAEQPVLVGRVPRQVPVHRGGVLVGEPVVEALVVAVVESLLLQRPLAIPVGLRDEDEVGMDVLDDRDRRRPVLVSGPRPATCAPRALEDVVHHQHRHVAAHAVALSGDRGQQVGNRCTECR